LANPCIETAQKLTPPIKQNAQILYKHKRLPKSQCFHSLNVLGSTSLETAPFIANASENVSFTSFSEKNMNRRRHVTDAVQNDRHSGECKCNICYHLSVFIVYTCITLLFWHSVACSGKQHIP